MGKKCLHVYHVYQKMRRFHSISTHGVFASFPVSLPVIRHHDFRHQGSFVAEIVDGANSRVFEEELVSLDNRVFGEDDDSTGQNQETFVTVIQDTLNFGLK